jgi:glucokinase
MILAGDIGGTHTTLALFEPEGAGLRPVREASFPSRQFASLEAIIEKFLDGARGLFLDGACFGVAGPVREGRAHTTNLPWDLAEDALARAAGAPRAKLLNDLEAAAYGMLFLPPERFEVLQAGAPEPGNMAVIAPGTGLGEAMLFRDGARWRPIASEGGHADFAPRNEREIALLQHLRAKLGGGHVSWERVLSGNGIGNVYAFLRDTGHASEPPWLAERLAAGDPNAAIAEAGLAGTDALCAEALATFAAVLGAEAGNLALRTVASAGVILGGGIPPKLLPALRGGGFLAAFREKGRFSDWLSRVPVRVALEPRAPLIGAAHYLFESGAAARATG